MMRPSIVAQYSKNGNAVQYINKSVPPKCEYS